LTLISRTIGYNNLGSTLNVQWSDNMDSPDENKIMPTALGLSWRSFEPADVTAIAALAAACLETDGGLPLGASDTYIQEHYLPALPGTSIGVFEANAQLVACATVQPTSTPDDYRATIVGQVYPIYRNRGIGTSLLEWSMAEASRLLSTSPPDRPHVILVATESLSTGAVDLFEQHGFKQLFAEDVMRRNLNTPLPNAAVPPGISFATWAPALAIEFFAVYQAAFRERPGFPNWSQEEWVDWLGTENDDFRAKLSLLAYRDDVPVGFVVCAEGWIVQVGVLPEWRERGIGLTLMIEVLKRFRAASGDHVLLDVNVNNPSAAQLYKRLGFERVGRRARYARVLA